MPRLLRLLPLLVALIVATLASRASWRFFSTDACRDNGGAAQWETRVYELGGGVTAPLDPPGTKYEWFLVIGAIAIPSVVAYAVVRRLVRSPLARPAA